MHQKGKTFPEPIPVPTFHGRETPTKPRAGRPPVLQPTHSVLLGPSEQLTLNYLEPPRKRSRWDVCYNQSARERCSNLEPSVSHLLQPSGQWGRGQEENEFLL